MPGFPFKLAIRLLKMVVTLLEWYASDDDGEKKQVEREFDA